MEAAGGAVVDPAGRSGSGDTETVRRIVETLDRLPDAEARQLAAFSYILSRVARADLEISAEETRAMERIVHELGGLPEEQAILVVQMAKTQSLLFAGTENFLVTREFNRLASQRRSSSFSSACSRCPPPTSRSRPRRITRSGGSPPSLTSSIKTWSRCDPPFASTWPFSSRRRRSRAASSSPGAAQFKE